MLITNFTLGNKKNVLFPFSSCVSTRRTTKACWKSCNWQQLWTLNGMVPERDWRAPGISWPQCHYSFQARFLWYWLVDVVLSCCFLKGKLKSKTLSGILESLSSPEQYLGEVIGDSGKRVVSLSDLKQGANLEKVVVVGVAAIVPSKEKVP